MTFYYKNPQILQPFYEQYLEQFTLFSLTRHNIYSSFVQDNDIIYIYYVYLLYLKQK